MQNHSGTDSVALGIVTPPWDFGPRQYLSGDNSALNKPNTCTNDMNNAVKGLQDWKGLGGKGFIESL